LPVEHLIPIFLVLSDTYNQPRPELKMYTPYHFIIAAGSLDAFANPMENQYGAELNA